MGGPVAEVLGPVRLPAVDGTPAAVPGAVARRLVVALVLAGPSGRSATALADDVWVDDPPRNPRAALQMLVSRLRSQTPAGLLGSTPSGYRIAASDLAAAEAAEDDLDALDAALARWRGAAGDDVDDPDLAAGLAGRAAAARLRLLTRRAELLLGAGRPDEAACDARDAAALAPVGANEPVALEMRALAAGGRLEEALAVFARHRAALRDQLGSDPAPDLVALHARLLRDDRPGRVVRRGVRAGATPLVGRREDLERLTRLARTGRLTTVLGAGGLGKTRLVMELAAGVPGFGRVAVVELAGVTDPLDLPAVIAAAAGDREVPRARLGDTPARFPQDARARLRETLADGTALLVLDNCEHLIDAAAAETSSLLADLPRLTVVTTSRVPLAIGGERVLQLAALTPAGAGATLFRERAEAARPGVHLDEAAVQRVCARLDGLPLAIELAAARMRSMSLDDLERRLGDRFALLVGADRSAPERHRTLLAVIDWSWRLLGPAEQHALRRLAAFPDGFTADAAAAALGDDAGPLLEELVLQSLLVVTEPPSGRTRFRMLETIREFGLLRAAEAGGTGVAEAGVDAWLLAFAAPLLANPDRAMRIAGLEAIADELDTMLAALRRPVDGREAVVTAVFGVLAPYWALRDRHGDLLEHGAVAVTAWRRGAASVEPGPTAVLAGASLLAITASYVRLPVALRALGVLRAALSRLPPDDARYWTVVGRLVDGALRGRPMAPLLLAVVGSADPMTAATALNLRAALLENSGEPVAALEDAEAALRIATASGLEWLRVNAETAIAQVSVQIGDSARARTAAGSALALSRRAGGDERQIRWVSAAALLAAGDLDGAEAGYRSLVEGAGPGDPAQDDDSYQIALAGLADAATARGAVAEAALRWSVAVDAEQRRMRAFPWAQLTLAGAVAAATAGGTDPAAALVAAERAERLRVRLLAIRRVMGPVLDLPVHAAGIAGYAAWLAWPQGGGDQDRAVRLGGLAHAMRARRDLVAIGAALDRVRGLDPVAFDLAAGTPKEEAVACATDLLRHRPLAG